MKLMLAALVALAPALVPALAAAQDVTGDWVNTEDGGLAEIKSGACYLRRIVVRQYHLSTMPGAEHPLSGLYTNTSYYRWMRRDDPTCAPRGVEPLAAYGQLRAWQLLLDAEPSNLAFKVQGTYLSCALHFCDDPSFTKSDFRTRLVLTPGKSLTDRFEGSEIILEFVPLAQNQAEAFSVMTHFLTALYQQTPQTIDDFVKNNCTDNFFRQTGQSGFDYFRQYVATVLRPGAAFEITEANLADRVINGKHQPALLSAIVSHTSADGSKTLEIIELERQSNAWKFSALAVR